MKYTFEIYKYFDNRDGLAKQRPALSIENQEQYGYYFDTEIMNLSFDYLEEIVTSLEQILAGDLELYDFGYEVYTIECRSEVSLVLDVFDSWKTIAEIPTHEIYELMRDWRDYLVEWELRKSAK